MPQAGHGNPAVRTITTKLSGPFGLDVVSSRQALVAGSDSGEVTSVGLRTGRQRLLISGLTGPSGVAAAHGRLCVLLGGPAEDDAPKPSKYSPASVLVVRPDGSGHGRVTHARVAMPTGFDHRDGRLYATSWSIASFLGLPNAGQLVQVDDRAFR